MSLDTAGETVDGVGSSGRTYLNTGNGSTASNLPFSENWESGAIDTDIWNKFGTPSPIVKDTGFESDYGFAPNGDGFCDSGAVTYETFPAENIAIDWYAKLGGTAEHDIQASLMLANNDRKTGTCEQEGEEGQRDHVFRVSLKGNQFDSRMDVDLEGEGKVHEEDVDLSWHHLRIELKSSNTVEVYLDDSLVYSTTHDFSIENFRLQLGERSGSPRGDNIQAYLDEIQITELGPGPVSPTDLSAAAGNGQVELAWNPGGDSSPAGYNVYRSTSSFSNVSNATKVNGSLVGSTSFTDTGVSNGTEYFYRVTAVDNVDNESDPSNQASAILGLKQIIAFTSTRDGNEEIYKMDGNGSDQVRLTDNSARDRDPAISPDGQEIVFLSDRVGEWELFKMDIDGSGVTQLTEDIPATQGATRGNDWSPSGDEIIFTIKNNDVIKLYRADPDGSNVSQLISETVDGEELDVAHSEYSPDGNQIVMDRNVPFQGGTSEIWIADADGGNLTKVTDAPDPSEPTFVGESGDLQIVHSRQPGDAGDRKIWKMNTDGSDPVNLSNNDANENQPQGPEGPNRDGAENYFLFLSDRGGERALWRMRLDGSNATEITTANIDRGVDWWVGGSGTIPVELVNFSAHISGKETAVLTWKTASETNNAGFDVQHQPPETKTWTKVGFVESKAQGGTTAEAQTYRFTAKDLKVGTHRFRLRQVDLDGSSTLTDPVTIELQMSEALRLTTPSPNPVSKTATLSFAVKEKTGATVSVYNMLGQRVKTLYQGTKAGGESHRLRLDASDLSSGTYFLRLQAGEQTKTRRLTVVR